MKAAIVSDEISSDFSTAVEQGVGWGIPVFEIRGLCTGRVPNVSEGDIREVLRIKEEYGITISALSPGAFKIPVDSPEVRGQLKDMLPRTYELAHQLGTDLVVIFAFHRPAEACGQEHPAEAVEFLRQASQRAEEEGIRLVLENEPGCWADTGEAAARLLREADHPNLRLNWDPCNSLNAGGEPYPEEYEAVKDLVAHLHVKDMLRSQKRYVPVGEGDIDWRGQLTALLKGGFDGYYTIETHYGPRIGASHACWENFRRMALEIA